MTRIDIHMKVPRVEYQKQRDMRQGERFESTNISSNADMRPAQIRKYSILDDPCELLMKTAMRQFQLAAMACHRVLK